MQTAEHPPNPLVPSLIRATVDACWLLPVGIIVADAFAGHPGGYVGSPAVLAVLFGTAIGASLAGDRGPAKIVGAVMLAVVWWFTNRGLFIGPHAFSHSGILFGVSSALYLGVSAYRGLAAGTGTSAFRFPRELLRGTLATSAVLLYLRIVELPIPIWPVLVLPTAIVAIGVMERSSLSDPTGQGAGLRIGGRWVVTIVVAFLALFVALLLTAATSGAFWEGVASILGAIFRTIGTGIAYLAYPFIYVIFWLFQLVRNLLWDIDPPEESTTPSAPELPEEIAEAATGAGPWATLAFQVLLAVGAALLIYWLFRSVKRLGERPDPGRWEEVRESLWEPGMMARLFDGLFSGPDVEEPVYRTETERRIRTLYRRIHPAVIPLKQGASETTREFLGRLAIAAPGLAEELSRLAKYYERARYGRPVEDEALVGEARETVDEVTRGWEADSMNAEVESDRG